jgi:hypothetical protein
MNGDGQTSDEGRMKVGWMSNETTKQKMAEWQDDSPTKVRQMSNKNFKNIG